MEWKCQWIWSKLCRCKIDSNVIGIVVVNLYGRYWISEDDVFKLKISLFWNWKIEVFKIFVEFLNRHFCWLDSIFFKGFIKFRTDFVLNYLLIKERLPKGICYGSNTFLDLNQVALIYKRSLVSSGRLKMNYPAQMKPIITQCFLILTQNGLNFQKSQQKLQIKNLFEELMSPEIHIEIS